MSIVETKIHKPHKERIIGSFYIHNRKINIINTKHGLFRIIDNKGMSVSDITNIILSIGVDELEQHLEKARYYYNEKESWDRQIDYVISIYDVIHEIVFMIGLHPHLERITIITVIPRVYNVISNDVFASYRVDSEETKHTYIKYLIPYEVKMNKIVI